MVHETGWQDDDTRLTTTTGDDSASASTVVPGLTILAHPDARRVGERIALPVLAVGREVRLSRLEPAFRPPDGATEGQPLAERSVSRQPVRLRGGGEPGAVLLDVRDTRTPVVADGCPVDGEHTLNAADVERGAVLQLGRHVVLLLHRMTLPFPEYVPRFGLVGESDAVVRLCQELERLAPLNVPVLLRGESGTGKELAARALHGGGPRCAGPFVAVNMATLSPSLAAAELFGAVRGAYTGAERKKKGLFQGAEGGTLFLDEIGETPVEVQAMLLRALENQEVLPVGSVEAQPVDVRIIAATEARLEEAMADGRFRTPLYHRLAGYAVRLPPLRERRDDVGRLLRFFLHDELLRLGTDGGIDGGLPSPPAEVVARLAGYDWPGNVRELRNVARRLAIAGLGASVEVIGRHLNELLVEERAPLPLSSVAPTTPAPSLAEKMAVSYRQPHEVDEDELLAALAANAWRIRPTAAHLGVSRTSLYAMIDRSEKIRRACDLSSEEIAASRERHGGHLEAMAAELRVSPNGLRHHLRLLATGEER